MSIKETVCFKIVFKEKNYFRYIQFYREALEIYLEGFRYLSLPLTVNSSLLNDYTTCQFFPPVLADGISLETVSLFGSPGFFSVF